MERVRDRLGPSWALAAARRLRFATASESAVLPIRRTGGFVHTTDSAKQKTPLTRGSLFGGEGGIRTHVGRNAPNRFRIGAVMTASVPLPLMAARNAWRLRQGAHSTVSGEKREPL